MKNIKPILKKYYKYVAPENIDQKINQQLNKVRKLEALADLIKQEQKIKQEIKELENKK